MNTIEKRFKFIFIFSFILFILLKFNKTIYPVKIDYIVAVVNEEAISNLMYQLAILQQRQLLTQGGNNNINQKDLEASIAKQLIESALLNSASRILDISVSIEEIDSEVERIKDINNFDDESFKNYLESSGYTIIDFKNNINEQLKRQKLVDRYVKSKIIVNDEKLLEYYNQHYTNSEYIFNGQNYMINLSLSPNDEEVKNVKKQMYEYYDQLKSGSINFEKLKEIFNSTIDHRFQEFNIEQKDLIDEFRVELEILDNYSYSEPFFSSLGIHIVRLIDKLESDAQSFYSLKSKIQNEYYSDQFKVKYDEYINQLYNAAIINIKDNNFKAALDYANENSLITAN